MTDNRTTELMKLLDERGEHYVYDGHCVTWSYYSDPHTATESMDGTLIVTGLTPEQAIAATLGSERGTCHAESDLSEWVCSKCQCWIPLGLTPENIMHASEWRYCPHCGARVEAVKR